MKTTIDIDESIKELSKWRKDLNYDRGDYCYGGTSTKHSLDVAINIIRKYQKIVQIMERTVDDGTCMYDTLQEIEEVIEDGNED